YEIWGSKGKITAERAFTAGPGYQPKIVVEKQNEKHEYVLPADNHFVNILKEFNRSISNNIFEPHYSAMYNQAELVDDVFVHAKKK
ncbi:MAG: gfo/Idh/MocA family oxidoreductase, partial [Bacteroidales bacterium]|nr:gfo/Idh/MocA family oxidoreductase [Bacteroidales bacterium]